MSKIESKYLNREIDVVYHTGEVNGIPTTIITHDSLEDVILNQLPDYDVRYDKTVEHIGENGHCIIKCTMTDNKGRRVQCLGESLPKTLYTEIAKGIPAIMAEIRAFDRAAIRYLNIPGKVYSNEEGVKIDEAAAHAAETVVDPADYADVTGEEDAFAMPDLPQPDAADPKQPDSAKNTIPSEPKEEKKEKSSKATKSGSSKKTTNAMSEEDIMKKAGNTVINFGKYQHNPKTVSEICQNPNENELNWINYVTTGLKVSDAGKQKQVNAIKYYMEHKGA